MNNVDVALFAATVAEESKESLTNAARCTTSVLAAIFRDGQDAVLRSDIAAVLYRRIGRGDYDGMRWELDEDGIGRQLHIPQWGKMRSDKEHPSAGDFYWIPGED